MDFSWSPTQVSLYDRTLAFAREKLNAGYEARERQHQFGHEQWRHCGEFGLLGLCIPEQYGGMGLDAQTTARVIEAFGRGCQDMGLVFSASAHLFACLMPILEYGSPELKESVLPKLASGAWIGANAITEAGAGSDVFALKTRAVHDGDDYILSGEKSYVTNGPVANTFVVYATTDPSHGYLGISGFVVPRETPGLVVGEPFVKVGLSTSPICSIYLEDCRVPSRLRIGAEGQGAMVFKASMLWERACLFAGYLGMMERQIEQVVGYAKQRKQFGKPIAKFQAVSHKIADMKLRLESARLLLYRACWLKDQGKEPVQEISLAKLAISEAAVQGGLDAIQLYGGLGVIAEAGVERMLRDALPSTLFSGTSEIQRDLIARSLGL